MIAPGRLPWRALRTCFLQTLSYASSMRQAHQTGLLYLLLIFAPALVVAEKSLQLTANTPQVSIALDDSHRAFLQLPDLDFELQLTASCLESFKPAALLISIADTRRLLGPGEFPDHNTKVSMRVPADQIAPVAIQNFCRSVENIDDQASNIAGSELKIPAALSAQVSLRCANDSFEDTLYASAPLDVAVICVADSAESPLSE